MLKKTTYAALLVLALSGCAGQRAKLDSNPAFSPHTYTSHDVALQWKSVTGPGSLRVEGTVSNTRYEVPYRFFELTATLFEDGKVIGKQEEDVAGAFVGSEPFMMDFRLDPAVKPTRIEFVYTYGREEDFFRKKFVSVP